MAHKVQYRPHLIHTILDQRTREGEAARALDLLHGQGDGCSWLFQAMSLIRYHDAIRVSATTPPVETSREWQMLETLDAVSRRLVRNNDCSLSLRLGHITIITDVNPDSPVRRHFESRPRSRSARQRSRNSPTMHSRIESRCGSGSRLTVSSSRCH